MAPQAGSDISAVDQRPASSLSVPDNRVKVVPAAEDIIDGRVKEVRVALELPQPETKLEPPSIDTLLQRDAEGGCEAACLHHCWMEPDGRCEHGHPSWMLAMGLIQYPKFDPLYIVAIQEKPQYNG